MKRSLDSSHARGLASLRNFVRKPPDVEHCDLCSVVLADRHSHLIDPQSRRLLCACDPCAILFSGNVETRYRRVPRDIRLLKGVEISDQAWNSLAIPIGLAFIYRSSVSGEMVAVYPSPAGPTESPLDADAWNDLVMDAPSLAKLLPDVEALLVNRAKGVREYFIAPIDECYRLTGLVRKHWRGFSGGDEGWASINAFFEDIRRRSYPEVIGSHAGSLV